MSALGVPHPHSFGLRPGAPNNVAVRWLKRVKATVTLHSHARYNTESLKNYLRWPFRRAALHAIVV